MNTPIRIVVVDDHTLFRRGLTALLSREPQFQVVGDAADGGEALRRVKDLQPDLVLLDNHLPGVNGVDMLPALREAATSAIRPPKTPLMQTIILSPGSIRFATTVSIPALPVPLTASVSRF